MMPEGDISNDWFIEFYFRNPKKTNKLERFRKMKGINKYYTLKERVAAAVKMNNYWTYKLRTGWSLFNDYTITYADNFKMWSQIVQQNWRKMYFLRPNQFDFES
jgi:hypothetical protein